MHSSPSTPYSADPASPFPVVEAQWGTLLYYLDKVPGSGPQTPPGSWLTSMDPKVLLTAIAKKRAEVELLRHARPTACYQTLNKPQSWTPLYDDCYTAFERMKLSRERRNSVRGPRHTRLPSHIRVDLGFDREPTEQQAHVRPMSLHSQSPLTPTFGPRRFDMFTGTVARRRSLPPVDAPLMPSPVTPVALKRSHYEGSKSSEKRIQWEAAWVEFERNLEAYVEKFGSGLDGRYGFRNENQRLWEELVDLKIEGERLKEVGYATGKGGKI
ncbi:hypothetical protein M011DRAFT_292386 [Sporormia fimetaria CBS 119925]|uniref:Uncharacterized protein n=1 Tax=Sporormia fimetaria CBS 119925 TaxID=1340428 RepID=A0A6A6UZ67_9PLEO|nr:hypothetical protein M011DRAFT_292386 [Sporormia fimetaria CBS 119925]